MGAAAADAAGSRREKAAAARRQGGGALTWTQADDFEAPARLRVRAPELYGRRSATRDIADVRLRSNNYRGPFPEIVAMICSGVPETMGLGLGFRVEGLVEVQICSLTEGGSKCLGLARGFQCYFFGDHELISSQPV
jgi:hypothetical protein